MGLALSLTTNTPHTHGMLYTGVYALWRGDSQPTSKCCTPLHCRTSSSSPHPLSLPAPSQSPRTLSAFSRQVLLSYSCSTSQWYGHKRENDCMSDLFTQMVVVVLGKGARRQMPAPCSHVQPRAPEAAAPVIRGCSPIFW